jgi:hypothetical protein
VDELKEIHSILLLNTSYHLNLVLLFYVQDYDENIVCQLQLGVLTFEGFSRMSSGKNAFIDLVKTKSAFTVPRMYQSVRSYRYC